MECDTLGCTGVGQPIVNLFIVTVYEGVLCLISNRSWCKVILTLVIAVRDYHFLMKKPVSRVRVLCLMKVFPPWSHINHPDLLWQMHPLPLLEHIRSVHLGKIEWAPSEKG